MQQAVPAIYCPNLKCRTTHPEGESICQACGSTIPQRYLWFANIDPQGYKPGQLLLDRYLFKGPQVVLDTQPGLPLASAFNMNSDVLPYLKLFPLRLHVPQLYSLLKPETIPEGVPSPLLLEGVPLTPDDFWKTEESLPELYHAVAVAAPFTTAWQEASMLRRVNWLWQIAQLWTPLQQEGVAWSLVNTELLRVEGSLLRLRSLQFNAQETPSLSDLGEFWSKWCLPAVGAWRVKFAELCDRLIQGDLETIGGLCGELEAWLAEVRATTEVRIDIATRTDPGPSRDQNEDACYPHNGSVIHNVGEGLTIVCDGVGGHAGGEVASAIAISVLTEHLQQLPLAQLSPDGIMGESDIAVGMANDLIVQQNDQENRQDRDRMGTTVVMALGQGHDLYLTNLGDSRAYLITPQGCYQISTDDDIATREVRLGYLPYRDAVRQPGAGSLIQALGMVPSSMLRPSVRRFVIDSDCLFLLCSDGLSDFERIESLWQTQLLPLLTGKVDLAETTKTLIATANQLNGHDNVTVALLHYHVTDSSSPPSAASAQSWVSPAASDLTSLDPSRSTRAVKEPNRKGLWFGLAALLLLGGAGLALGSRLWLPASSPVVSPSMSPSVPSTATASPSPVPPDLKVLSYWSVAAEQGDRSAPPLGSPDPQTSPATMARTLRAKPDLDSAAMGSLTQGLVFQVKAKQENQKDRLSWAQVQICGQLPSASLPVASVSPAVTSPAVASPPPAERGGTPSPKAEDVSALKAGVLGYIPVKALEPIVQTFTAEQLLSSNLGGCTVPTPRPSSPSP